MIKNQSTDKLPRFSNTISDTTTPPRCNHVHGDWMKHRTNKDKHTRWIINTCPLQSQKMIIFAVISLWMDAGSMVNEEHLKFNSISIKGDIWTETYRILYLINCLFFSQISLNYEETKRHPIHISTCFFLLLVQQSFQVPRMFGSF